MFKSERNTFGERKESDSGSTKQRSKECNCQKMSCQKKYWECLILEWSDGNIATEKAVATWTIDIILFMVKISYLALWGDLQLE